MCTWNLSSLSLTRQQTEITIWMLAANQKVKVILKGISLLKFRIREYQDLCSAIRPSAKILDSGCLLCIWIYFTLKVSCDTFPTMTTIQVPPILHDHV